MKELYLICKQMSETNNVEDYERQEEFIKGNIENINSEMLTNIIINGSKINSLSTIELLKISENKINSKDFINIVKSVNQLENLNDMNDFIIRKDIIDKVYNSSLFNIEDVKDFICCDIVNNNKLWLLKDEYIEKTDKDNALKMYYKLLFLDKNNRYVKNALFILNNILSEEDINENFCSSMSDGFLNYGLSSKFKNIVNESFIKDLSVLFNMQEKMNNDNIFFNKLENFFTENKKTNEKIIANKKQKKESDVIYYNPSYYVGKTFFSNPLFNNLFEIIRPFIRKIKNKNNENLYFVLFEKHGFFEAMSFYNFEFIDLLFEKNIYDVSAIDILISKNNIVDLSWLLYFLEKSKNSEDISKEKEKYIEKIKNIIKDMVDEELDTELYNLYLDEDNSIEILNDTEFKKIKEILDEKIKEENTVELEELTFACIELFKKESNYSHKSNCLAKIKTVNKLTLSEKKIIGIVATILYSNNCKNENAIDIYSNIISEIEDIKTIETAFSYLYIIKEKGISLEQKKEIVNNVLINRKGNPEKYDEDREIIINSISGYSTITKNNSEIKDDKQALSLISKVKEKIKNSHIYSLDIKQEEINVSQDATLFFDIYTEKDVEILEKNLNEFKQSNDPTKLWVKKLKNTSGRKKLAINTDLKPSLDKLRLMFPNFEKFINFLENNYYLNSLGNNEFYFPPSLLNGPAGIGKTFFLSSLAKAAKTSYSMISMESVTASFMLTGSNSQWENGSPGEFFNNAISSEYANNILLLDEIDKCRKGNYFSVENSLLPLLEIHTAQNFKDEFVPLKLDISKMIWLATSNNLNDISLPIRSRFEIFNIKAPNFEERKLLAQSIYSTLLENNHWGKGFVSHVNESVLDCLCEDDASSRDLRKNITRALAKSAARETSGSLKELIIDDIEQNKKHEIIELWDRKFD